MPFSYRRDFLIQKYEFLSHYKYDTKGTTKESEMVNYRLKTGLYIPQSKQFYDNIVSDVVFA